MKRHGKFFFSSPIRLLAPMGRGIHAIVGITASTLVQRAGFNSLLEVGYGDSYILHDILNFEKTGRIYRTLAEAPYLPALYSPLVL